MMQIKTIVQPTRLEGLRQAFRGMPSFPGMTVYQVRGAGSHINGIEPQGIRAKLTDYSDKVCIDIVVPEEQVCAIVDLIHRTCHTGRRGDGVVWVLPVSTFRRMRETPPAENGQNRDIPPSE